jgi:hypothetical protein
MNDVERRNQLLSRAGIYLSLAQKGHNFSAQIFLEGFSVKLLKEETFSCSGSTCLVFTSGGI